MDPSPKKNDPLSLQTLKRLPHYYNYLCSLREQDVTYVAAPSIARDMGIGEVQVRKDLAAVSRTPGKPRLGFDIAQLIDSIGDTLGYNSRKNAVLVGVGQLGRALLGYKGFEEHGVHIAAAFDADPAVTGTSIGGRQVAPMEEVAPLCRRHKALIGIIAVPARAAQGACDLLVDGGVSAIWNFAPVHLMVPEGILVHNENLAASLALLSQQLLERRETKD